MSTRQRAVRLTVAAAVGASVFVMALTMSPPRSDRADLPPVSQELVARAEPDGHGHNVVNVVLVDFRGFDTLGEISVLVAASIGTVALARSGRRPRTAARPANHPNDGTPPTTPERPVRPVPAVHRQMVSFAVSAQALSSAALVGSVYLLFAGHNQPGGGFVGGIVAGAAVSLQYLIGGIGRVRRLSRAHPWTVLGTGLALSAATAAAPLLTGKPLLRAQAWELHPPLLGTVRLASTTVFDVGVYLVVVGLALMMFESFGDNIETPPQPDDAQPEPVQPEPVR